MWISDQNKLVVVEAGGGGGGVCTFFYLRHSLSCNSPRFILIEMKQEGQMSTNKLIPDRGFIRNYGVLRLGSNLLDKGLV